MCFTLLHSAHLNIKVGGSIELVNWETWHGSSFASQSQIIHYILMNLLTTHWCWNAKGNKGEYSTCIMMSIHKCGSRKVESEVGKGGREGGNLVAFDDFHYRRIHSPEVTQEVLQWRIMEGGCCSLPCSRAQIKPCAPECVAPAAVPRLLVGDGVQHSKLHASLHSTSKYLENSVSRV